MQSGNRGWAGEIKRWGENVGKACFMVFGLGWEGVVMILRCCGGAEVEVAVMEALGHCDEGGD